MRRNTTISILSGCCAAAIVFGLLAGGGGCSRTQSNRLVTYPAGGLLFQGGKPAAGARVQLIPMDDPRLAGLHPHAIVEADGSFQLTTYKTHDGAPTGTYALTVTWPLPPRPNREEGPDRLQGRYADRGKPAAKVGIVPGNNPLGTIQIK